MRLGKLLEKSKLEEVILEQKESVEKQTMASKKKKKVLLKIVIVLILFVSECCVLMYVTWMCVMGYVCNVLSDYGDTLSERLPEVVKNEEERDGRNDYTNN